MKEILNEKEKRYLKEVIRPFRKRVVQVVKYESTNDSEDAEEIMIIIDIDDGIELPYFRKGTMYKNMKIDTEYNLRELGIEYEED